MVFWVIQSRGFKWDMSSSTGHKGIIEVITSPLGFFALALLIVEGFLATVLIFSDLAATVREKGMWAGIVLFVLVVVNVSLFAWFKPTHLVFTELGTLVQMGKATYGTEGGEVDVEDLPSGVSAPE